jgi:beta-galactosidase beta subunit
VGKFMIFYPDDAHAPLAARGPNVKAVIKVAV